MRSLDERRALSDRNGGEPGFAFDVPGIEQIDVMVVDGDSMSLGRLEAHLRKVGHPVRAFDDAGAALESIREQPPSILIADTAMPGFSGADLTHEARTRDPAVGVILLTDAGNDGAAAATPIHGVSAYIAKPVDLDRLQRTMLQTYLECAARVHHQAIVNWMYEAMDRNAQAVRDVTLGTLTALINALDARSPHFRGHSQAVAMQAAAVAHALGLDDDEVELVRTAGLLHDIGMIGVPDAIVDKPDALTPAELDVIRGHCAAGAAIIEPMTHLARARLYILEHHERLDGSGYPERKRGDEISLGGQIVGIAEAWTGILASRPYRGGLSRKEGLEILRTHQGEWFSTEVTQALIESDVGLIG